MYIYIIENLSSQLSLIYYSAVATRKLVLLCYLSELWAESYTKNSILCEKVNYRLELNYKQIHEIGLINVQFTSRLQFTFSHKTIVTESKLYAGSKV